MLKKLRYSFILAVLFILVGGLFCLFPTFSFMKTSALGENSESEGKVGKVTSGIWVSAQDATLSTQDTYYGHENVFVIESAENLAYISHEVNAGNSEIANGVFLLSSNLDLSGAFWVPIGTYDNPFRGIFYGAGHTISNISVDDISVEVSTKVNDCYEGLFGRVDGATICDVVLSGYYHSHTTSEKVTYKGTFAGSIANSTIINCYDETHSSDEAGEEVASIGNSLNSRVYVGGSHTGAEANYTSQDAIAGTLTGAPISGYVGFYKSGSGEFYKQNKVWTENADEGKVGVVYTTDLQPAPKTNSNKYLSYNPLLRKDAVGSENVYVLRNGYKPNIEEFDETDFTNGLIKEISYDENAIVETTLDYLYGTRKPTLEFEYDQTFDNFFNLASSDGQRGNMSYLDRLGYTFDGIYSDKDFTTKVYPLSEHEESESVTDREKKESDFELSYPAENETYYFKWIWNNSSENTRNFRVKFAYASDEGGLIANNFSYSTVLENQPTGLREETFENLNEFTSDSYTFGVTLKVGYRISAISTQTGEVTVADNRANKTSGAYVNFTLYTGEDTGYNVNSRNNDNYNYVSITGKWLNEENYSMNKEIAKSYEFTLDNVVGAGGEVVLVIERDYIDVDVSANYVAEGDKAEIFYTTSILANGDVSGLVHLDYVSTIDGETKTIGYGETTENMNGSSNPVLYVRRGENVSFRIRVISESRYLVSEVYNFTFPQVVEIKAKSEAGGINKDNDYYKIWDIDFTQVITYGSKYNVNIGSAQTRVGVNLLLEGADVPTKITGIDGIGVRLNSGEMLQNVSNEVVNLGQNDQIAVTKNGRWQAVRVEVVLNRDGSTETRTLTSVDKYLENYYITSWGTEEGIDKVFKEAYTTDGNAVYTVNVYFVERVYDVKVEYYMLDSNNNAEARQIPADMFNSRFTSLSASGLSSLKQGETVELSFYLKAIAMGAIYYDHNEIVQDGGEKDRTGHVNSAISESVSSTNAGEYTFTLTNGGYDSTVKFYFKYKSVNFSIDKIKVKGEDGLISNDLYTLNTTLTYLFTNEEARALTLSGSLTSISIHSQYYLLGWYLKNGEIEYFDTSSFDGILTNSDFVNAIALSGSGEGASYSYNEVASLVGRRTVTVDYVAGEAGEGKLYENTNISLNDEDKVLAECNDNKVNSIKATGNGSIVYDEELTLSLYAFFNLGYEFAKYSPNFGAMVGEVTTGSYKYVISGDEWDILFKANGNIIADAEKQTWNTFTTTSADDEYIRTANVTLTANWSKISYIVEFDGENQATLSIGDSIYYETEQEKKDGRAYYTISGNNGEPYSNEYLGSSGLGYIVIGYRISQKEGGFYKEGAGEENIVKLTPDIFLQFIKDEYRFKLNSGEEPIAITTEREAAKYFVYLDNIYPEELDEGYFKYIWDESTNNGYGQEDIDGQITLNVTFGSVPENITKALESGTLTIERKGYEFDGWAVSDGGRQISVFDTTANYSFLTELHLTPIWRLKGTSASEYITKADIKFADDVVMQADGTYHFWLLNSFDIIEGFLSGDNVGENNSASDRELILSNGDKVTSYGFILNRSTNFNSQDKFNISNLLSSGTYYLSFRITVEDSLSRINSSGVIVPTTYTTQSRELIFVMEKNELYLFNDNFATIYNGTEEFVASPNNEYGQFVYRYDWNGADRADLDVETLVAEGETNEYFNNFKVADENGDFNATTGKTKTIKMKLNLDKFGSNLYENLLLNITKEGNDYYLSLDSRLKIEKAIFAISFPKGSGYLLENEDTIVFSNNRTYQFNVGQVTFTYTFDKIVLPKEKEAGVYAGQEDYALDSSNFRIDGLVIEGHESDYDNNFEWVIAKGSETANTFSLLDTSSAQIQSYVAKYLRAENGQLLELEDNYKGVSENIYLSGVVVNGETMEISGLSQGSFLVDNDVIMTYSGNGTKEFKVYINKALLSGDNTLSFTLSLEMTSAREQALKLLTVAREEMSMELIEASFNDGYKESYSYEITPNAGDGNRVNHIILSDVVKVYVNYNGGTKENESIYVSAGGGNATIINSPSSSKYLSFDQYARVQGSNLALTRGTGSWDVRAVNVGNSETLTARWSFNSFDLALVSNQIDLFANEKGINLERNKVINLEYPEEGITNKIITLNSKDGQYSFSYSLADDMFLIAGEKGYALPSVSGTYTVTVSLTYSDNAGVPQTITKNTDEFELVISINTIDLEYNGDALVFNNSVQEGIALDLVLNGIDNGEAILRYIEKVDNAGSDLHFYLKSLVDSENKASELRNADTYTLTFAIDSDLTEMYQFAGGTTETTINLNIAQFTIVLSKYQEQLNLSKYVGADDPNPILGNITIGENNNDQVLMIFTRQAGESVGRYQLSYSDLSSAEDKINYTVDSRGFNALYNVISLDPDIDKSEYELIIAIDRPLEIVYSKEGIVFDTSYNFELQKWIISYQGASSTISLSYKTDEGETAVGGAECRQDLNDLALKALNAINVGSYTGSDIVVEGGEGRFKSYTVRGNFNIIPRTIEVENIEKIFDGNDTLYPENVTFANLANGDELTLSGRFIQSTVGQNIQIADVVLGGKDAENYTFGSYTGKITPRQVTDVKFKLNNTNFTYGGIAQNSSISDILALGGGYVLEITFKLDDNTSKTIILTENSSGEEANFARIDSFRLASDDVSNAGYLKAGNNRTISFIISSSNFTNLEAGYDIIANVDKLEIDLSSIDIIKSYDENALLPSDLVTNIDAFVFNGDKVVIDLTNSSYENAEVGYDKPVTIVLAGDDSANYRVKDNVKGGITAFTIKLKVNLEEIADLVSNGAFVDDGVGLPTTNYDLYSLGYPSRDTNEALIESLMASNRIPTRRGYTLEGWTYLNGSDYVMITSSNIVELLKSVAEDETNADKEINIYPRWQINKYLVDISQENIASVKLTATKGNLIRANETNEEYFTGSEVKFESGYTYYVEYYSDLKVEFTCNNGLKIRSFNLISGETVSRDLTNTGEKSGVVTLGGISSAVELSAVTAELSVTFQIDYNKPDNCQRVDKEDLSLVVDYFSLENNNAQNLPKLLVTKGTFRLTGYSYEFDGEEIAVNQKTLKEIVDMLYPNLDKDETIVLKANWIGEDYTIKFDPNGGTLEGETTEITLKFADKIQGMPSASLPGRILSWTDSNGNVINDGDQFLYVGSEREEGGFEATFTALWTNATFDLTITFGEKLTVNVNGQNIESGKVYQVTYSETNLQIIVTADAGYTFVYDASQLNGDIEDNGYFIVSNLIADGQLSFTNEPAENELKLFSSAVKSITVQIAGKDSYKIEGEDLRNASVKAFTGERVTLIYEAEEGYAFDIKKVVPSIAKDFILPELTENARTITIVWAEFTSGSLLTVDGVPADNVVTTGDLSDVFLLLSLNGRNINLSGDTFTIKTGETLNVSGVLVYGYKDASINTGSVNFVVEGSENCIYSDNYYRYSVALEGFKNDFNITFTLTSQAFNFELKVEDGQEELGQILSSQNQTVNFGADLALSAEPNMANYEFAGWRLGETIISRDSTTNYRISSAIRDALVSAGENGIITIYATFSRKAREISFSATGKGSLTVVQDDKVLEVEENAQGIFYLGEDLTINVSPVIGYELDYVLIDGQRINLDDYDFDGKVLILPLDLDSPFERAVFVFKASAIEIIVQAGTVIGYIQNLGTDVGGRILMTDSEGNRLEDDQYYQNEGQLLIGANYRIHSFTGETIYFFIEAKPGFSPMLSLSQGMIRNEIETANGRIYEVKGASNGSIIKVLFTAIENQINIRFATVGEPEKAVHGGIIAVNVSNLITASPTRGDNLKVNLITGADLSLDINSLVSHTLLTDNQGKLRYEIIYSDGRTFDSVEVSDVTDCDRRTTGFNNHATLSIENITIGATIVIYVEPKEYTLRFVVDEQTEVIMSQKIHYGDPLDLSQLSSTERDSLFPSKREFTFNGYFTKRSSFGTQYIDKYKEVLLDWQETGYTNNGSYYEKNDNYDELTDTFTLYAGWTYNRASVRVELLPSHLLEENRYNIYSFITNLSSVNAWVDQNEMWYGEIAIGSSLNFRAPEISGYTFAGFTLSLDGGDFTSRGNSFSLTNIDMGNYVVRAVYNPNFYITIQNINNADANGGISYIRQDGGILSGSYDFQKFVTLVAVPNEGYKFLYWLDPVSGRQIVGEKGLNGEYVYTYDTLLDTPLNLVAVFEGKLIAVNLRLDDVSSSHNLLGVTIDGKAVNVNGIIYANVGSEIRIVVKKVRGYGFGQSLFSSYVDADGNYVFTYTFKVEDLSEDGDNYKLTLPLPVTKEDMLFTFELDIASPVDKQEVYKVGNMDFIDTYGRLTSLTSGDYRNVKYGDTVTLRVTARENYRYDRTILIVDGVMYDISEYMIEGQLQINKALMDKYFDYSIKIRVSFTRLYWTDEDGRASEFVGKGTKEEPYLIRNARDFALMAYLVNSGAENEDGLKYSEATYKVTNDINFAGRYWIPVGTKDNPFNGKIDLGKFEFENISHYKYYSDPKTSYSGLFWHIGKKASITVNKKTFTTIILIIVFSIIGVILIVLLILLLYKRRKRKLEKYSNQ